MILNNGDIILISDIDEIPRDSRVAELASLLTGDTKIVIFEQIMTKFFLNNISQVKANNTPWLDTVACTYGVVKGILPQGAMIGDLFYPPIGAPGACKRNPAAFQFLFYFRKPIE
ncbi:hypothetical+protein [Methylocapsa aurea]|uniref:hypothetical protein n=1 Tax=Methylocapsa aurea TaxID=663610 RepID=UPI003D189408